MASGTAELNAIIGKLGKLNDPATLRRVQHYVGGQSKKAVDQAAQATLGPDKAMRNFKRGHAKIRVGYDLIAHGIQLNLRPRGLWVLAEEGRKGEGEIRPKGKRKAVMTPEGPRRLSHYKRSRGLKAVTKAEHNVERISGKATDEAMRRELAKVVRG